MPITPENKKLYPSNWAEIRSDILRRAVNRCEFCGVENHAVGLRDRKGKFWTIDDLSNTKSDYVDIPGENNYLKIVLTIAHLDQDPTNNDYSNLRALCQRCHNRLDMPHRIRHAKLTRWNKNNTGQDLLL